MELGEHHDARQQHSGMSVPTYLCTYSCVSPGAQVGGFHEGMGLHSRSHVRTDHSSRAAPPFWLGIMLI